jgi:hypothetical protein
MDKLFVLMSERGSLGSVQEQSIEMSGIRVPLPLPRIPHYCGGPQKDLPAF